MTTPNSKEVLPTRDESPMQQSPYFRSGAEIASRFDPDDEAHNLATYGKPPYWFVEDVPPRYAGFAVHWKDAVGREYMFMEEHKIGIRLPIVRNRAEALEFPQPGEELVLTEHGGGQRTKIRIVDLITREGWTTTAAATVNDSLLQRY